MEGEVDLHTARDLMAAVDETFTVPGPRRGGDRPDRRHFLGSSGLGTLADLATRAPASAAADEQPVPVRLVARPDNRAVLRPWETMNLRADPPAVPGRAERALGLSGGVATRGYAPLRKGTTRRTSGTAAAPSSSPGYSSITVPAAEPPSSSRAAKTAR